MSEQRRPVRADFPHYQVIPTRWIDNDIYGHMNNALYYAFFDTVINQYLIDAGGLDIHAGPVIGFAVETHCEFYTPIAFPDVIDAGLAVSRIGKSSVRYQVGLFRKGSNDAAAFGYFIHVFVDRISQRPVAIPGVIRKALERLIVQAGE